MFLIPSYFFKAQANYDEHFFLHYPDGTPAKNLKYKITADDGQVDLSEGNYLGIGTLESYQKLKQYYGEEHVIPVYIEVEDGERLQRALLREREQEKPKYEEMCRRFLADQEDFSEENIREAGIKLRFANENLELCVENIIKYINSLS